MVLNTAEALAIYGFNPEERVSSLDCFQRQKEAYALHVIEDRPVTNKWNYYIKDGEIFIDEDYKKKLFIDPEERGGYALLGTQRAVALALKNPGKVIFLYSPSGSVVFSPGTKYDKVAPYLNGQLYIMIATEGNKVEVIPIGISKDNEGKFLELLGIKVIDGFDDEKQKIIYYLSTPRISSWNWDINSLLAYLEGISYLDNFLIYRNIRNEEFYLADIVLDLKRAWLNEIRPQIVVDDLGGYIDILRQYVLMFPLIYAPNGTITLGGGCGGSEVKINSLFNQENPLISFQLTPLSTNWRVLNNGLYEDRYGKREFECPHCYKIVRRPEDTLLEKCPHCGKDVSCK